MKRAVNPADIVVNRDDDDDDADLAEKGEKGDTGTLAMFGAPSASGSGSGSGSGTRTGSTDEKDEDEKERSEMAHEGRLNNAGDIEEHPRHNVLASEEDEQVERREGVAVAVAAAKAPESDIAAKEKHYCAPGETTTWTEGRKVSITPRILQQDFLSLTCGASRSSSTATMATRLR